VSGPDPVVEQSPEKGGVLRTQQFQSWRRLFLVAVMAVTPLVVLAVTRQADAAPRQKSVAAPVMHRTTTTIIPFVEVPRPVTTVPVRANALRPRSVSVRPVVVHHPLPVRKPPTPPVTTPPVTTPPVTTPPVTTPPVTTPPTTAPPRPHRTGRATWYSRRAGLCAVSYLPRGTRIWVRDLATGATITCVVNDTEAPNPLNAVDLSAQYFQTFAPLWRGVVPVIVTW
jgi:hypothetical protein